MNADNLALGERSAFIKRVNESESGTIPLLFKDGNVSALKQSVNSFTRSDALGYGLVAATRLN